jgi:hypothetical protein
MELAAVKTPHPPKWSEREVAKLKRLAGTMPVRDLVWQTPEVPRRNPRHSIFPASVA